MTPTNQPEREPQAAAPPPTKGGRESENTLLAQLAVIRAFLFGGLVTFRAVVVFQLRRRLPA